MEVLGCGAEPEVALPAFRLFNPDCVVIDVPARNVAGYELLSQLRAQSASCFIVVLTNQQSAEFERRSLEAGANEFLCKSSDFERVPERVRALEVSR